MMKGIITMTPLAFPPATEVAARHAVACGDVPLPDLSVSWPPDFLHAYPGLVRGDLARPRKTRIAWFKRIMSPSSSCPVLSPSLVLGTVVILSTMSLHGA